ncbi:hypothetical protein J6590_083990 [Homalodisca vitripennis]|nr:hypothetical protein J6590_083990 [Homalodisca vitripennis]
MDEAESRPWRSGSDLAIYHHVLTQWMQRQSPWKLQLQLTVGKSEIILIAGFEERTDLLGIRLLVLHFLTAARRCAATLSLASLE